MMVHLVWSKARVTRAAGGLGSGSGWGEGWRKCGFSFNSCFRVYLLEDSWFWFLKIFVLLNLFQLHQCLKFCSWLCDALAPLCGWMCLNYPISPSPSCPPVIHPSQGTMGFLPRWLWQFEPGHSGQRCLHHGQWPAIQLWRPAAVFQLDRELPVQGETWLGLVGCFGDGVFGVLV